MLEILHVDDEPDIREVAAMSLGLDPAINVRSVSSGAEALDALAGDWRPNVIMLDVMMPGLDGPGTLEQIRSLPDYEATPVIFMTARAQAHEQSRLIGLGAIAVIIKPFDPMTLAELVRSHLASPS
ncbi:response regulator [soil metagenome]